MHTGKKTRHEPMYPCHSGRVTGTEKRGAKTRAGHAEGSLATASAGNTGQRKDLLSRRLVTMATGSKLYFKSFSAEVSCS